MKNIILLLSLILISRSILSQKNNLPQDIEKYYELLMKVDIGIDSNWYPDVVPFPLINKSIKFYEIYSYADSCSSLYHNKYIVNFSFYVCYFDSIVIDTIAKLHYPEIRNLKYSNNIPFIIGIDWRKNIPYRIMGFRRNDVIAMVNNMYTLYRLESKSNIKFKKYLNKIDVSDVNLKCIYLNYSNQKNINCNMGLFSIYDLLGYGCFSDKRFW